MSETRRVSIDTSSLTEGLQSASREMTELVDTELLPAAAQLEDAFASVATTIEKELSRAAKNGSLSLKSLTQSITRDLAKLAVNSFVREPIKNGLTNLFGGARAAGGPVAAGAGYLVGERGPEMFVPNAAGRIQPKTNGQPVTVNLHLGGVTDPRSFAQSQSQIAAGLTRALSRGNRNF